MVYHEALDLQYWLVNVLAGSPTVFIFLALIAVATLSAVFRMPNTITLIMFVLLTVFLAGFGFVTQGVTQGIEILIILAACLFIYYSISKALR